MHGGVTGEPGRKQEQQ